MLYAFPAAFRNNGDMMASCLFHCFEAGQAITDDITFWHQTCFCIAFNFTATKTTNRPQLYALRPVFFPFGFDNRNKGRFVVCTTPWFAGALATNIGIIGREGSAEGRGHKGGVTQGRGHIWFAPRCKEKIRLCQKEYCFHISGLGMRLHIASGPDGIRTS